jgi:hypothetical protein
MNHNWFYLEKDTTPPVICIDTASRISPDSIVPIKFIANEPLSNFQSIFIVDAEGTRHPYIFEYVKDICTYEGFEGYLSGFSVLYGEFKDEVDNPSVIASKVIYVGYLSDVIGKLSISEALVKLEDTEAIAQIISLKELQAELECSEAVMELDFKEAQADLEIEMRDYNG